MPMPSETPQPATTEWAGFPILAGRWIDTEGWLDLLNVDAAPWQAWVYTPLGDVWFYIPEDEVTAQGAWIFAPNFGED